MPDVVSTEITKIYENTNLTVKTRIDTKDAKSIEEVTFKFLKDGEQFGEKAIPISEGKRSNDDIIVSHMVQAPAVADDKDRYFLDYHYFYKVKSASGSETLQNFPSSRIQVFPRVAQLKVTDKDGKAFPNFEFMVEQDGVCGPVCKTVGSDTPNAKGETIPAGSCEINLGLFPNFRIVPSPPFEILEEVVGTGRKREIKGTVGFRAFFVAPQKGNIKQFVNYEIESMGQQTMGHAVTVDVGVNPEDLPFLKPGDTNYVHFRVTFGPDALGAVAKSERNDTDNPTKVMKTSDADTSATIEEKEANKKYEGKIKLADGAGKFVVALGKAGGDTCKVEISGSEKFLTDPARSADATLTFENWRLVHYELMVPNTLYEKVLDSASLDFMPDTLQRLETLGRTLFVEFVHEDTNVFDARGQADYGTLGPKPFFGMAKDDDKPAYVLSGRNWRKPPKGQSWAENQPMKTLYIHLCDRLLKWRKDTADESAGTTDLSVTLTEAVGVVNVKERFSGLFMPFSGHDGGDALTDIDWTADITKDDAACKYSPTLSTEAYRYEQPKSAELSIDLDFDGDPDVTASLTFSLTPDAHPPSYNSEVSEAQVARIKTFVGQILSSYAALAAAGGKATVWAGCREGDDSGEFPCLGNVTTKLQEAFDELKKDFAFHPGLDPANAFAARTGSCSMAELTDFATSTVTEWHYHLPAALADGSAGPGAFIGAEKSKTRCPITLAFSIRPHEVSTGEAEGKLLAWPCGEAPSAKHLTRIILRAFDGNGDTKGLAHGHSDGKPGDCLLTEDVVCEACLKYGRARNLTGLP